MSSRHRGLAPSQLLDGPGDTVHILALVWPYGQLGVTLAFSPPPLCTFPSGSDKVVNTSQPVPRCSTFNFNLRYVHFANSAMPLRLPSSCMLFTVVYYATRGMSWTRHFI